MLWKNSKNYKVCIYYPGFEIMEVLQNELFNPFNYIFISINGITPNNFTTDFTTSFQLLDRLKYMLFLRTN